MIGKQVGRYQIQEQLGQGGMGVVYKALDPRLDRTIALKFLPNDYATDEDARQRFIHEARAASALDHPNICTIHDIGESDDGRTFIAMAYYEGQTLKERLRDGALPVEESTAIVLQIAEGLSRAHKKGIVHRDIKPANIFLTEDGLVKILDFGIAKMRDVDLTRTGSTMGTVAYMSPEQARGEAVDQRTDIWSLGVILYEMLAGRRPFQASFSEAMIYSILHEEITPLSDLVGPIDHNLERIVRKTLTKELSGRYADMNALLEDLHAIGGISPNTFTVSATKRHTVGRYNQLAILHEGLKRVFSGKGLLIGVAGEAGIGKTTLIEEFLDELAVSGRPIMLAKGQCSERLAGTEAYLPIFDALEWLLQHDESIAALMRERAPWWYVQIASLSPENERDQQLIDTSRHTSQVQVKRELAGFLEATSRSRPLVLFFEDLHWADVSTIDLLAHLGVRFERMKVLIVTTYRPVEMQLSGHPFLQIKPDLISRGQCQEIELHFLSTVDIEEYLSLEYPGHSFPNTLARLIYERTEGSPLFMADLVRDLEQRSMIQREYEIWQLTRTIETIQLELPDSVRAMIDRKISQLAEEERQLMIVASVQGFEFDSAVLAAVLEKDEEEVEERLQKLEDDYRFVEMTGEDEFPEQTLTLKYRFVHVLYQNALYATLRPTKRARMSRAVAEMLLNFYEGQSQVVASELAVLFDAARDYSRAAEYFCTAAQEAARVFAYREAENLARRGLEQLNHLLVTPKRDSLELMLQMALGLPLTYIKGWGAEEVGQVYGRARQLCRQVGETPKLGSVLCGLSVFYLNRVEFHSARELGEQALNLAQSEQDTVGLLEAHHTLAAIMFGLGVFTSACEHCEWVVDQYDQQQHGHLSFFLHDPGVACLSLGAVPLWILGYPDKARKWADEALALARALSSPFSLTFAMSLGSNFHQFCRNVQATQEHAEAAVDLAGEQGFGVWTGWGTLMQGWVLAARGDVREGIVQLRNGLIDYNSTGSLFWRTYTLGLLADAYGKARQIEKGLQTLHEAIAMVEKTDERIYEAELHRLKGELLLMQTGSDVEAEGCFKHALDVARQQQAKSFELRTAISLGRLWYSQGKTQEARDLLAGVYDWFTEGFDTHDLKEARALIDELK